MLKTISRILLIAIVFALMVFSFFLGKSGTPTGYVIFEEKKKEEMPQFSLHTAAICAKENDKMDCQDVLFAKCGGIEYKLECVNGSAEFIK